MQGRMVPQPQPQQQRRLLLQTAATPVIADHLARQSTLRHCPGYYCSTCPHNILAKTASAHKRRMRHADVQVAATFCNLATFTMAMATSKASPARPNLYCPHGLVNRQVYGTVDALDTQDFQ
jgi:hypothetical protein